MPRTILLRLLLSGFFLSLHLHGWTMLYDTITFRPDLPGKLMEKMSYTKSQSAMEEANIFAGFWDSDITPDQKDKISLMISLMEEKNLPPMPYYLQLMQILNFLYKNGQTEKAAGMADMFNKVLLSADNQGIAELLVRIYNFLEFKCVYYSKYYRLYYTSDEYSFEFEGDNFLASIDPSNEINSSETAEIPGWGTSTENGSPDDSGWPEPNPADSDEGWGNTTDDSWGNGDDWNNSEGQNNEEGWSTGLEQGTTGTESSEETGMEQIISTQYLPVPSGALVKFQSTDLIFSTPYDSVSLRGTSGSWVILDKQFIGNGGSITWDSDTLGTNNDIQTVFSEYVFQVDYPEISAENTYLEYPKYFEDPIEGNFDFKSTKPRPGYPVTYPRFISYDRNLKIKMPGFPNLLIRGGFEMTGQKITTRSLIPGFSFMELQDAVSKLFFSRAPYFELSDSLITSPMASLSIYQGSDSIHHPGVELTYSLPDGTLVAEAEKSVSRLTPFLNSYYSLEADVDKIYWEIDSNRLDMSITQARKIVPATFESYEYYNEEYLESLSGINRFNPLLVAVHYARQTGIKKFLPEDLAKKYKLNPQVVKMAMQNLTNNYFIEYDQRTGLISPTAKAFHYADAVSKKNDYDELKIRSISVGKPNASIDMDSKEMKIRGIDRFYISEVLDVFVFPDSSEISVLKDRDLKFNGRLFAGNFEFIGREFLFKYDSFYVDMAQIDSIRFYVDDPETGEKKMVDNKLVTTGPEEPDSLSADSGLTTHLTENSGRLYINRPDNKSGVKIYPNYPNFNAARGAIVYFNNKEVLNGAYDESIYFVIPPFEIDSLSDSDPASIGFEGTFYGGDLVPPFTETIHIMPDNSLGFEHILPPEGYPLYKTSGRLYNKIRMDKMGLTGEGRVDYLTSSLYSFGLSFYLDSLTGYGNNFKMEKGELEGGSFPDASLESFRLKWLPKKDSLYLTSLDQPFYLYDRTATLSGTLNINRLASFGRGELLTRGSVTRSEEFYFVNNRFGGRHADFTIQSNDPEKPILSGDDIKLNFALDENFAEIEPETEGVAAIEFPFAQFRTSIPNAVWNLETRDVEMIKPEDTDIAYSYFYSTREDLDSLAFNATQASYNIDNFELLISGIPYIKVADAKITPENNQVLVLENSRIGTLTHTTIEMDTITGYHSLYNGTIDIISRHKFEGDATYRYVNDVNDTFAIKIDQFELVRGESSRDKNALHTRASGFVSENDGVVISPGMIFKGEAIVYAPDPAFALDGYIKLEYRENPGKEIWIEYTSTETTSREVKINFATAVTEEGENLMAGIHYDSNDQLYSTFINPKKSILDTDFFTPNGLLYFDEDSLLYRIEDTLKTSGASFEGKIFNLNIETSELQFEGPVNFNLKTKDLELQASVIGNGNMLTGKFLMDAFLTLNFNLPTTAWTTLAYELIEVAEVLGLPQGYEDDPALLYKLAGMIGEKSTRTYENLSLEEYTPLISISPKLNRSICLSSAKLYYSPENKSWYNRGKIGISNIGNTDVNVLADGFMEIKKSESGDILNLFFQLSPSVWYYFNFEENKMVTSSSNNDFNGYIKDKTNAAKANFGEYFFVDGNITDVLGYINRFRKEYLGINDPYDLEIPVGMDPDKDREEEVNDGFQIPKEVEKKKEEEDDEGF